MGLWTASVEMTIVRGSGLENCECKLGARMTASGKLGFEEGGEVSVVSF
jgi:hypothetical protein